MRNATLTNIIIQTIATFALLLSCSNVLAIKIIPHFTAGVLVCNGSNTTCHPVICSTDTNNPTPTPTGPNVYTPVVQAFLGSSTVTSCMTPTEMASVNQYVKQLDSVTTDPITVDIEYYDSPIFFGGFSVMREVLISPKDPIHHPEAAYNAVVNRLKVKSLLNSLLDEQIEGPYSVNTTLMLPNYNQITVQYPQTYPIFTQSNFVDNSPQTFEYYPQTIVQSVGVFNSSVTKPIVMIDNIAHFNMLTANGLLPLPNVNITPTIFPLDNTIANVNGTVVNAETGIIPVFYDEKNPAIVSQQINWPTIVSGNYITAGINAFFTGNLSLTGVFPANWNPGFDFTAFITHENIHNLGWISAEATYGIYVDNNGLPAAPATQATGLLVDDLYMIDVANISHINSPQSFALTPRLQQFEGFPLSNGNFAGHHVFVYHVGNGHSDTTKYIGTNDIFGGDFNDWTYPVPTSDFVNFSTFQQSDDSPSFTDRFGNVLNSSQTQGAGLFGQISPLSIRELILLNSMGYGVKNVKSVEDGNLTH